MMRPKLKDYVFFAPVDNGVFFRSLAGETLFRGTELYPWIERLAPLLNGTRTLDSLVKNLDEKRGTMVTTLIERLTQAGLVRDSELDVCADLTPQEMEFYAASLAHLENHYDHPYQVFATLRRKHVLIVGDGPAHATAVLALLEMGLSTVTTWTASQRWHDYIEQAVAPLQQQDPAVRWNALSVTSLPECDEAYDAVLAVDDVYGSVRMQHMLKNALASQRVFLHGGLLDGQLFLGPLVRPDKPGCPVCTLARLDLTPVEEQEQPVGVAYQPFSAYHHVLGYTLAYWLFCWLTGLPTPDKDQGLVHFDLDTLTLQKHHLSPWPTCPVCCHQHTKKEEGQILIERYQAHVHIPSVQEQQERLKSVVDPLVGILATVTEGATEQLPIHQVHVAVRRQSDIERTPLELVIPAETPTLAHLYAHRAGLAVYARKQATHPFAFGMYWWTAEGDRLSDDDLNARFVSLPIFATGLSYTEWLGTGLLELVRREIWSLHAEAVAMQEATFNAQEYARLAPYLKMLRIRFGITVALRRVYPPFYLPGDVIALFVGKHLVDLCVDTQGVRAAERGLLRLLQHTLDTQQQSMATLSASTKLTSALQQGLLHDLFQPETDWEQWVPEMLQRCQQEGWQIVVQPQCVDQALDSLGLLTGFIGFVYKETPLR